MRKGFFERFGRFARSQPSSPAPALITRAPETRIQSPAFHQLMDGAVHVGMRPRVRIAFRVTDCEVCGRHLFDRLLQIEEGVAQLRQRAAVVPDIALRSIRNLRVLLREHSVVIDLGGVLHRTQPDHWHVVEQFDRGAWSADGIRMPTDEDLVEIALRYGSRFCEPFPVGSINPTAH